MKPPKDDWVILCSFIFPSQKSEKKIKMLIIVKKTEMPFGGSTGSSRALYNNQQFTTLWLIGGYDCNMNYNPVKSAAATNVDLRVMGGAEIYKTLCVRGNIVGNLCAKKIQVDLITDKSHKGIFVKSNIDMNCLVVGNVKVLEVEIITNKPMANDILMIPQGNVILAPQSNKAYVISNMYISGNINMSNTNINKVNCIDVFKIKNVLSDTVLSEANINPSITDTFDLGNLINKWRHVYTQDITICGNVYGNIHANALPVWVPDATSNLDMHCFTIANCMAFHVHDLYGKSPIEVHDNFNMNSTTLGGDGGRITWQSGIQIGDLNAYAGYSSSIALGKNAIAYGENSVCVGHNSKSYGYQSIVIGYNNMSNVNNNHYYNIGIGSNNFPGVSDLYGYNIVIGYGIANNYTTPNAWNSILIGRNIGTYAYYSLGGNNVAIGNHAMQYQGYYGYGGGHNIAIGYYSMRRGTYGEGIVAIGNDACGSVVNTLKYASYMIGIGSYAGYCMDSYGSIAIGANSTGTVLNSRNQTFSPSYIMAIGYNSMRNVVNSAHYNMAIGHFAMGRTNFEGYAGNKTTGTRNTCVGFSAGQRISNQHRNVFIGHNSGRNAYGSESVSIGYAYKYANNVSNRAVSIGANCTARIEGVGIGYRAYARNGTVAIGELAYGAAYSVAVGLYSDANEYLSIAIGSAYGAYNGVYGPTAAYTGAIAIGCSLYAEGGYVNGPRAEGLSSIAIGGGTNEFSPPNPSYTTRALNAECIAIGKGAIASGINHSGYYGTHCSSIAIGASTRSEFNYGVSIGYGSFADGNASVAILGEVRTNSHDAVAIKGAVIRGRSAVSIGGIARAYRGIAIIGSCGYEGGMLFAPQTECIAIGSKTYATKSRCIALGYDIFVGSGSGGFSGTGLYSVGIGKAVTIYSAESIAIGNNAYIGNAAFPNFDNAYQSIAIGKNAACAFRNSISIGYNAKTHVGSNDCISVGTGALSRSPYCIVIGKDARTLDSTFLNSPASKQSIIIGKNARTNSLTGYGPTYQCYDSVALGTNAYVKRSIGSIAMGLNATVSSFDGVPTSNCIVMGTNAVTRFGIDTISIGSLAHAQSSRNIAIGKSSVSYGGSNCVAIGYDAANYNIGINPGNARNQIAIGRSAETGHDGAIAIGAYAMSKRTSAPFSAKYAICIGGGNGYASRSYALADGSIAIGNTTRSSATNAVAIGSGIVANQINGFFAIHRSPVASASTAAWVGNELVDTVSSARFKQNIIDLEESSNKFDQLRPVRFNAKPEYGNPDENHIGLIAEELNVIYPEFVVYEDDKVTPKSIQYDKLVALLIKELQLEKSRRNDLENRILSLESKV